jgi:hypothetical protein
MARLADGYETGPRWQTHPEAMASKKNVPPAPSLGGSLIATNPEGGTSLQLVLIP